MTSGSCWSCSAGGISIHMPHTWHDTVEKLTNKTTDPFQSTCHIRGMTFDHIDWERDGRISIHMPHTWHDGRFVTRDGKGFNISIHMPHTWHDPFHASQWRLVQISIHMPHTWHDTEASTDYGAQTISIHMPHTWHDLNVAPIAKSTCVFQSTCHIRGMTFWDW